MASRKSARTPKRKVLDSYEEEPVKRTYRACPRAGCPSLQPKCFAHAAKSCAGPGYTPRWNHLSDREHFCNECFEHFYRRSRDGNKVFEAWRRKCAGNCRKELNVKFFMAEEIMPYWLQCCKCKKWREVTISNQKILEQDFIKDWNCSEMDGCTCSTEEEMFVQEAKSRSWLYSLVYMPLLRTSPSTSILKDFFPDGVGISPNTPTESVGKEKDPFIDGVEPFYKPDEPEKARCFCPDRMTAEEKRLFPHFEREPYIFLGLRNLILTLWNKNFKEYLSHKTCVENLVIRGLVRITLSEELKCILDYLTSRGYINFGVISNVPKWGILTRKSSQGSVVVIGSGFAGISAAIQLKRFGCKHAGANMVNRPPSTSQSLVHRLFLSYVPASFRLELFPAVTRITFWLTSTPLDREILWKVWNVWKVIVLEARNKTGGRTTDDYSFGCCIGKGPQIITGCTNNPMYVLCKQLNLPIRFLRHKCNLINEKGKKADNETDERVDLYFNMMLESLEEWKQEVKDEELALSLEEGILLREEELEAQSRRALTETESDLIQFHLANLEYACGAKLSEVSALHWNQNEIMPQFIGRHAFGTEGFEKVTTTLTKELDIRLNTVVSSVDYSSEQIKLKTTNGTEFFCDKVVVAVPLSVLKKDTIKFNPTLPSEKLKSVRSLGSGLIEKIVLKFPTNFWSDKIENADYFGKVPSRPENRGFGCIFYDLSTKDSNILMTVVAGAALREIQTMKDKDIVDECVQVLRKMFIEETVPDPSNYMVTRWSREKHIEMAYSYVGTDGCGEDYDSMEKTVDNKVYFAGEATHRQFPQTVSGAFLSGVREAHKILADLNS